MSALAEIVVDIPIEDQAADKALEVALFYEGRGWVPRDSYTWILYARSGMSYELLQSFRQDIIVAAQRWKRAHGLDENLFALIVELARAGVIWRPSPPTSELRAETAWLWKEMGLAAIQDRALAAAGVAFREEAESIRARVALLDGIAELPGKIAMASAQTAFTAVTAALKQYIIERNKTIRFMYQNYPQMSETGKELSDHAMAKIRGDDETIRTALAKVNLDLSDFGSPTPALTLGVELVVTTGAALAVVVVALSILGVFVTAAIIWHLRTRSALEAEQLRALKSAEEKALAAIETERRRRILDLSPELSVEERAKAVASIDAWAAGEESRVAQEHKEAVTKVTGGLPWAWILGTAAATPVAIYGAGRAFGWIKEAKPKPTPIGRKRGPKTGFAKFWRETKPYVFGVGGAAAAVGLLGMSALFLKWTMLPSVPASRAPELPAPEPYEPPF